MSAARSPGNNRSFRFFDIPPFRRPCRYRSRDIRHFACTFSLLKLLPLREQSFAHLAAKPLRCTLAVECVLVRARCTLSGFIAQKNGNGSFVRRELTISVFGLLHKGITH